jgi:hypothetical protein
MKMSYVIGIALLVSVVWACQQDLQRRGPATEGVVFACASTCEGNKIYNAKGECPVCHTHLAALRDVPARSQEYEMRAVVRPTVPQAERPVELALRPTRKSQEDSRVRLTGLDGKGRVHVLLVSEDLVWFDYRAAEREEKGVYRLDATFPGGGRYFLYAEYQPRSAGNLVDRLDINVTGAMLEKQLVMAGQQLQAETDRGLTVDLLSADGDLHAQSLNEIAFEVKQGKNMVTGFDKLLGAQGHLFLVRADRGGFAHLRAEMNDQGRLVTRVPFDTPGLYRAFLEFQVDGQIHKAAFTIKVENEEPVKHYTLNQ